MKFHIIDSEGKPITVTDLDAAIEQADGYRQMQSTDRAMKEFDTARNAYWSDVHEKLLLLKKDLQL